MKKVIILMFALLAGWCAGAQQKNNPALFPSPVTCQLSEGVFVVNSSVKVTAEGRYAKQLKQQVSNLMKQYGMDNRTATSASVCLSVNEKAAYPKDAYLLEVTPTRILLEASTESGLFYAKESLVQLLRYSDGKIPACRIEDHPRTQWRGVMLDEARHFFGKEKVMQLLDVMASLKLNVFHWHLTDEPGWRIEIKKYPKLTTIGSVGNWADAQAAPRFYTQEEIKEIVAYAAQRHIMVVPEIDMPGHATAACKSYPEVSAGGTGRWKDFTYHPCKEETFEFLSNVLEEVAALFPAPYIHVGGDEVHYGNQVWFTDPQIQAFIKENNLKDEVGLEHYFIRRAADLVRSKGKTMIGWDEMVDAGVTPDKAVIMWWRHDKEKQLEKALEKGYQVILTPRRPLYFDFVQHESHRIGRRWDGFNPVELVYNFPGASVQKVISGKEQQVMGYQMSVWTERIADCKRLDFMIYPRIAAVAEAAWTPAESKNSEQFMQNLPSFLKFLDTLNIYYFNPFDPASRTEPTGPSKADVLQNG